LQPELFVGVFMNRFLDVCFSVFVIVLVLPIFFLVVMLIFLGMGRPVFFYQTRPGLNARPFRLIKFRTMLEERTSDGVPLQDSERLTNIGRFLRATSLDELPEFLNVLRGDMSLVGPRPLLMQYLPLYTPEQSRRHEVRPGITGWAQINGRNALSWEEKFELDVWYVDNRSLWLDIKILFKTVLQVLKRDGISHGEDATMPRFKGSDRDD
jgi:sugar transferase EpsL